MPHFSLAMNEKNNNGLTIRENNLQQTHGIPLFSMVRINGVSGYENATMFVVSHSRDCDGTPLYDLAKTRNSTPKEKWDTHFSDECLTVIASPNAKIFRSIDYKDKVLIVDEVVFQWINSPKVNDGVETVPQEVIQSMKEFITDEEMQDWMKDAPTIEYINTFQKYVNRMKFVRGHEFKDQNEADVFAKAHNIALIHEI